MLTNIFLKLRTILKDWRVSISLVLLLGFFIQLGINVSQGYGLLPRFKPERYSDLQTFHSTVTSFAIDYPPQWLAQDLRHGNHGDMEVIAHITTPSLNAPIVEIAYTQMPQSRLSDVAVWGRGRLRVASDPDWIALPVEEVLINGQPAFMSTFHRKDDPETLCYQTYILEQSNAFVVQMCMNQNNGSPELKDLYKQMIQSIKLS